MPTRGLSPLPILDRLARDGRLGLRWTALRLPPRHCVLQLHLRAGGRVRAFRPHRLLQARPDRRLKRRKPGRRRRWPPTSADYHCCQYFSCLFTFFLIAAAVGCGIIAPCRVISSISAWGSSRTTISPSCRSFRWTRRSVCSRMRFSAAARPEMPRRRLWVSARASGGFASAGLFRFAVCGRVPSDGRI